MVILGAGGHAKEVLDILLQTYQTIEIALFDDVTPSESGRLFFQTSPNLNRPTN